MGLDMYGMSISKNDACEELANNEKYVGTKVSKDENSYSGDEFFYWRKHPNLHGLMEDIARDRVRKSNPDYFKEQDFNCVAVRLTESDLDDIEKSIMTDRLPETAGFFFGISYNDADEKKNDLEFIDKARQKLKDGKIVYYTSWW